LGLPEQGVFGQSLFEGGSVFHLLIILYI